MKQPIKVTTKQMAHMRTMPASVFSALDRRFPAAFAWSGAQFVQVVNHSRCLVLNKTEGFTVHDGLCFLETFKKKQTKKQQPQNKWSLGRLASILLYEDHLCDFKRVVLVAQWFLQKKIRSSVIKFNQICCWRRGEEELYCCYGVEICIITAAITVQCKG